jgi:hypothetical protein
VSEIQRIVHPPCDSVIRVVHRREQAQSKPGLAAQTRASGKSPAACHGIGSSRAIAALVNSVSLRKKREPSLEQLVSLKPETEQ